MGTTTPAQSLGDRKETIPGAASYGCFGGRMADRCGRGGVAAQAKGARRGWLWSPNRLAEP